METTRQQKIARLIQKELSDIFQRQTQATHGVLVSVSAVRVSPDLSIADYLDHIDSLLNEGTHKPQPDDTTPSHA